MKVVVAFFLCFFVAASGSAQKADSLEQLIHKTKADSSKAILLGLLAEEETKTDPQKAVVHALSGLAVAKRIQFEKGLFRNYFALAAAFQAQALFDSSAVYFHHALASAMRDNNLAGQANVYSGLGHCFMRKSQMDSAQYYLATGLTLAKRIKNYRIEAGIYNNYGNIFLETGDYQKALDYFIQAAKLYENPLSDNYGRCLALSNIGNIEYRLGNNDRALGYANQSMAIAKRESLTSSIGYGHKLLGRIYRRQKLYDSALTHYQAGQKIYSSLGDTRSNTEILQNIGNIYYDKEQFQQALESFQKSLTLARSIANKSLLAHAYSCIGQAFMKLEKNEHALLYLDSSRRAAAVINNKYLIMDSYEAMSSVYEATGDYKQALAMHHQFVLLKDSIRQSDNRQLSEETHAKYELEKKEAQIALLEKDKELKNLALGRSQAIQTGVALVLVLVIVIALLLVNWYRVKNQVKRNAEIERVRDTIARDLHDDIGSTLSTINIISKLAMLESPTSNSPHLGRIAEQSSRMMESMTDMVWSINPVNDSMEKVIVKMKIFASEILEPKNIRYSFFGEESLAGLTLDAEKRKNLFLVFKEAVNNAAKYSEATSVDVMFERHTGQLAMTISDNGHGFTEHSGKGNGLKNMEARTKAMHAKFQLTSSREKGTRVRVEMPLT
jgi:signal transduction histidine kinase